MTDETRQAFAHPRARAAATADTLRDRILLDDHVVEVEIGAFRAERGATQRLAFDIVAELRPAPPAGDDVDRILSYDRLTEAVSDALATERLDLLETLAERIADRILAEPQAERVFVRIRKLDRGPGALGVEIVRSGPSSVSPSAAPRPVVALISAEAAARPGDWRDALLAETGPLVLCVEAARVAPDVTDAAARGRIELLELDQAAWRLSALLPEIEVRDNRTELDWAQRKGAPSLWAPTRMAVSAVAGPKSTTGADLAAWLAETLDAREILLVGAAAPSTDRPLRSLGSA
ncbi:MAG: dihydroneopterin aldolase [Limimaricola soesokkakensis]|uniref:dihydroneopterin aldolase n=1 Tax=Limimaricola soesokkakensis TaxID=1343159 RepID=A0A1X6YA70_9RHOB|nr:dihydroneopterin aldolase [Limimaricola soesokkakensis]PSK87149.1 dihydroneopterin aldolase [Limimaricola soesokkakensis]SLN15459.1 bifunctional dihydroneopterin aldolase/dihydroneopterin triphosphate 2'-epimerase [Limimaricola soesokkakensis]